MRTPQTDARVYRNTFCTMRDGKIENSGMDSSNPRVLDLLSVTNIREKSSMMALTGALNTRGVLFPSILLSRSASLLIKKGSSLGDDKWTILERILLSAIKLDVEPWIGYCLKALRDKFPKSERVERLGALYRESKEDWAEAESIYKGMLQKSPDNLYARKRLVASLKAQGRMRDCISAIIDQLDVFSADSELWHELSMLYMSQAAFSKAAASFDEVILMDPRSFYNLLVFAEMQASAGDWLMARKYFCRALEYRPNEVRALWGLLNCLTDASSKKADVKETKLVAQLSQEVKKRLTAIYEPIETNSAKLCLGMIRRM